MLWGLIINYSALLVGDDKPFNQLSIPIAFWLVVAVLIILNLDKIHLPKTNWIYTLFALPLIAVVGAELFNHFSNNIVPMIVLPIIAVIPFILIFTKVIPEKYYAFTIWIVALSVILHRCMISQILWGSDNLIEYGVFRVTEQMGIWDSTASGIISPIYNTNLSVTILPLMFSKITFISGFWIFKLCFPLLLSIVPVTVYELFKNQFSKKIAFLSAFLILSLYTFFTTILSVDKQLVAVVLMMIFFLVVFDDKLSNKVKYTMYGLLGFGVIVSHYSTAIMFLLIICGVSVILWKNKKLPVYLTIPLGLVAFVWYFFQGDGIVLKQFFKFGQNAVYMQPNTVIQPTNIDGQAIDSPYLLLPQNEAIRLLSEGSHNLTTPLIILYISVFVLVGIGLAVLAWKWFKKRNVSILYLLLSSCYVVLLGLEVVLPRFSAVVALDRLVPMSLMLLAPLMMVGVWFLFRRWKYVVVCTILVVFFLFNVGWVNQVIGKPLANSIALSQNTDFPIFTEKELEGADWAIKNLDISKLYYDSKTYHLFVYEDVNSDNITGKVKGTMLNRGYTNNVVANQLESGSYIYLRKFNLTNNTLSLGYWTYQVQDARYVHFNNELGKFNNIIQSSVVVFDNGDCRILKTTEDYK